jgi:hypothetical protein
MIRIRIRPVKWLLHRAGYELRKVRGFPPDFEAAEIEDIISVKPYTVTSNERIVSLIRAVKYIVANEIAGDIVECGVYKGGSILAVLKTLIRLNDSSRQVWLYDTFEGMTKPGASDVSLSRGGALEEWEQGPWCYAPFEEVRRVVLDTGYDEAKIHFVKGRVEETLPTAAPRQISLLRLDTDWYESTMHELNHLFPRLSRGGVIIIDDYGHWAGARKAVDEFLAKNDIPLLLSRIDYTGRIGVKI